MSEVNMMQGVLVRGFGGFYVAVDESGTEHISCTRSGNIPVSWCTRTILPF